MWLEYIRYRFRLDRAHDLLELTQVAALKALRNSSRCRGWRVLPAADDPTLLVLEIEWDPGAELAPFRGSEEFATIHSALAMQARSLEEADYSVNSRLLRQLPGGTDTLFRLAEDIVVGILGAPELGWRFQSEDGSKRGRLGLWLLEVLGGPDLFTSSFPGASTREGPLAHDRLDLEERERLLEIATEALPRSLDEQSSSVVGNLRAHLPLHPSPRSRLDVARLLGPGDERTEPAPPVAPLHDNGDEPDSEVRHVLEDAGLDASGSEPAAAPSDSADSNSADSDSADSDSEAADTPNGPSDGDERLQRHQTGVHPRVDDEPTAQAAGLPWPRSRAGSAALRSRATGRWPRWRARTR